MDFAIQLVSILRSLPLSAFPSLHRENRPLHNAVAVQVGWAISAAFRTEKLYDGLGSSTFIACAIGTLTYSKYYFARQLVATIFVIIWGARLGGFLVFRVLKTGTDSRFDEVKSQPCMPARPHASKMPTHHTSACSFTDFWRPCVQ